MKAAVKVAGGQVVEYHMSVFVSRVFQLYMSLGGNTARLWKHYFLHQKVIKGALGMTVTCMDLYLQPTGITTTLKRLPIPYYLLFLSRFWQSRMCLIFQCAVHEHSCPIKQCTKEMEELLTAENILIKFRMVVRQLREHLRKPKLSIKSLEKHFFPFWEVKLATVFQRCSLIAD